MSELEQRVESLESMLKKTLETFVDEIRGLRKDLVGNKSDYCNTTEALILLGLKNPRDLKKLSEQNYLYRTRNGVSWNYKKSECLEVGIRIFNKEIIL